MPYKDPEKQRAAQRKCMKRYYQKNKDQYRIRDRNRRARIMKFVNSLKKECGKCGFNDTRALDFHHINPSEKKFSVGKISYGIGMDRLIREIEKCIVLCANCHRIEESSNR